jgi:CrcB protein
VGLAIVVGLAGALGAVARYLIDGRVQDRTSGLFPYGTLAVNVVGSLLLGIAVGLATHGTESTITKVVIGTGFCGGLTTWSTAAWESIRLLEEGTRRTAIRYTAANLAASLGAAAIGLLLVLH